MNLIDIFVYATCVYRYGAMYTELCEPCATAISTPVSCILIAVPTGCMSICPHGLLQCPVSLHSEPRAASSSVAAVPDVLPVGRRAECARDWFERTRRGRPADSATCARARGRRHPEQRAEPTVERAHGARPQLRAQPHRTVRFTYTERYAICLHAYSFVNISSYRAVQYTCKKYPVGKKVRSIVFMYTDDEYEPA